MPRPWFNALILASPWLGLLSFAPCQADEQFSQENLEFFEAKIRPILVTHCYACHSKDSKEIKGGLRLDTRAGMRQGGESGAATVIPKDPGASLLLSALRHDEFEMPPQGKLPDKVIADFETWIKQGAADPREGEAAARHTIDLEPARRHWAFQPLTKPVVPAGSDRQNSSPIDAFIRNRMELAGIRPADPAKPHVLLRRVYLDLIGLPPTRQQQDEFARNPSAAAYAAIVDDLLARPQYGERWGRHWLDVVRYAETKGYERDDFRPGVWRYRDYVIRSFNADKPYDQFLTEQLAGDELPDATPEMQLATTFLRLGPYDSIANSKEVAKYNQLDDILGTTTLAFMGQTIQCARCHDHKFEPIAQLDYFKLLGAFESLSIGSGGRKIGPFHAFVFNDNPKPKQTRIHVRGNVKAQGKAVAFGLPAAFDPGDLPPPAPTKSSPGRRLWLAKYLTGPGSHLTARVIANRIWHYHFGRGFMQDPSNFGIQGGEPSHPKLLEFLAYELRSGGWKLKRLHKMIVLSNTYRQSAVHPNPRADIENIFFSRWPLHRLQAEAIRDSMLAASGKLNLKMGGESIHPPFENQIAGDSSKNTWKKSPEVEASRRSVYVYGKRAIPLPDLSLLDAPESTESCGQRRVSTTAVQSLLLLNGKSALRNAVHLAERIKKESQGDRAEHVHRAFQLVLCRPPSPEEIDLSLEFLDSSLHPPNDDARAEKHETVAGPRDPLTAFCLMLFNTNEFVYAN